MPGSLKQMPKEHVHGNLIQEEPPNSCNIETNRQRHKSNYLDYTTPNPDICDDDPTNNKNLKVMDDDQQLSLEIQLDDRMQHPRTDTTHQSHTDHVGKDVSDYNQELRQNTLTTDEGDNERQQYTPQENTTQNN
jgi:hypothetical protein